MQVDWAEMPTRPRIAGRERRVYALICALPFSGASTAHFSFDMTIESFLEGHVRAFAWLGGVPRECVYDNLRSAVARARRRRDVILEPAVRAAARPLRLSRARLHAGDAAREGLGRGRGPPSQDRVLAGAALRRRWASSTSVYADWRDRVALPRRHATGRTSSPSASRIEREALRPLPPVAFDAAGRRSSRVPLDGYLKHAAASTARRRRWSISASSCAGTATASGSSTAARRSPPTRAATSAGVWQPAPRMRPEPPPIAPLIAIAAPGDRPAGAQRLRRALRMTAKTSGGRRAAALPARQAQGAARPGAPRADRRAGARGGLALRAVPRGAARGRGLRPRRLRRPHSASATPPSPPTRPWRTSTSPPSPAPRSR